MWNYKIEDPIVLKETRIRSLLDRLRKTLEWEGQAEQKSGVGAGRRNKTLHAKETNFQSISFIQLQMYWYPYKCCFNRWRRPKHLEAPVKGSDRLMLSYEKREDNGWWEHHQAQWLQALGHALLFNINGKLRITTMNSCTVK